MAAAHRTGPVPSTPNQAPQPVLLGPGRDFARPWPRPDMDVDRERRLSRASAYVLKADLGRIDAHRRRVRRCLLALYVWVGFLGTALVVVLVRGGVL